MADEQLPEKKEDTPEPLLLDPSQKEEAPKKKEEPASVIEEELPPITPLQTFWSGIDAQTSVKVTSPIDPPEQFGEPTSFNGNIVFKDFPQSGHSFTGTSMLIHGTNKDRPNCSLILPIGDILASLTIVANEYIKRGDRPGGLARLIGESLPTVFAHVFKAIKAQSPKIYWSKSDPQWYQEGKSIPLVTYIYDTGLDKDLGINLVATFEGMKSAINKQAEEILAGGKSSRTKKEVAPLTKNRALIRDFVSNKIPETSFKLVHSRMIASLLMSEVEKLGGKEVADIIRSTPAAGAYDLRETGDVTDFWYRYDPDKDVALFENKRLTDRKVLEKVQKIWKDYGGGTPQDLFKSIAGDKEVGTATVVKWFTDLLNALTPDIAGKLSNIFGLPPDKEDDNSIKKLAYPAHPWAGPSLDQVGALIGDAQAKWASELAGTLAAKFDYISYPKLEGSPSDLRKLATLPLTPTQIARVEKYRANATRILQELYRTRPAYTLDQDTEDITAFSPRPEEAERLAEDTLLELVEATPSSMPDEEFLKELRQELMRAVTKIHAHPHAHWPSTKVSPGDALQGNNPSFDTVRETHEVELTKVSLLKEEDAVQIVPGHPDVPAEFYGKLGKVHDVKADIFMCPEHGPEPFIRYLVELGGERLMWFREDELRTAGTTN